MLSKKMIEALEIAKEQENCINRHQLHPKTAWALRSRGLIKPTQGYGWKFGALYELTEEGEKVLEKVRE